MRRSNTMKAIVRDRYGSPDVLMLAEIERPAVKDDDVLVRVRATSLNADDLEYLDPRCGGGGLTTPKTWHS